MKKEILLAMLVLLIAVLACGQEIRDWERQQAQGAKTPPINEETKYLCVIPTEEGRGALVASGEFTDVVPGGTRLIDSGERWAIANEYAIVYWKGFRVNIALNLVEPCE